MRMRIYRNYMLRQVLILLCITLLVFTFIFVVGNIVKLSDLIINKKVNPVLVLRLFLYLIPFVIGFTIPIATVSAMVLLFGRLSADNEINALRASGVSLMNIIFPVLALSFVLSLLTFIINDKIEPHAHYSARRLVAEMGVKQPLAYLEPGSFIDIFPGYIIFIYQLKDNFMKYVRIYQLRDDQPPRVLIAERGQVMVDEVRRKLRLKLRHVISDEVDPRRPDKFYKFVSDTYFIAFDLPKNNEGKITRKLKEHDIRTLLGIRRRYKDRGIGILPIDIEINKRLAFAFAPLVLSIFAIPLSIKTARNETSVGITVVALITTVYYFAMLGVEALSIRGVLPPYISMWLPDILFMIIGFVLLARQR